MTRSIAPSLCDSKAAVLVHNLKRCRYNKNVYYRLIHDEIFLLFYMCRFTIGHTHYYKPEPFFNVYNYGTQYRLWQFFVH